MVGKTRARGQDGGGEGARDRGREVGREGAWGASEDRGVRRSDGERAARCLPRALELGFDAEEASCRTDHEGARVNDKVGAMVPPHLPKSERPKWEMQVENGPSGKW